MPASHPSSHSVYFLPFPLHLSLIYLHPFSCQPYAMCLMQWWWVVVIVVGVGYCWVMMMLMCYLRCAYILWRGFGATHTWRWAGGCCCWVDAAQRAPAAAHLRTLRAAWLLLPYTFTCLTPPPILHARDILCFAWHVCARRGRFGVFFPNLLLILPYVCWDPLLILRTVLDHPPSSDTSGLRFPGGWTLGGDVDGWDRR